MKNPKLMLKRGAKESLKAYDKRINALTPLHVGYAYFTPGNYQRDFGRFGVYLVWNEMINKMFRDAQPSGGYYIHIQDAEEAFFLNISVGIPVYSKLVSNHGKLYPGKIYLRYKEKRKNIIFNGCDVESPSEVYFKGMEEAKKDDAQSLLTTGAKLTTTGVRFTTTGTLFSTTGNRFVTTGYQFNTSGNRFATTGYQFSTTGNRFATTGYQFSTTGNRFATTGYRFSTTGNRFATTGYQFNTTGNRFATTGYQFSTTGNRFATTGYQFNTTGNRFATTGYQFSTTGNRFATTGYQFSTSGKRFTTTGGRFTTTGKRFGTTGSKFGTTGKNFCSFTTTGHSLNAFIKEQGFITIVNEAPISYDDMEKIYGIGTLGYGLDLI